MPLCRCLALSSSAKLAVFMTFAAFHNQQLSRAVLRQCFPRFGLVVFFSNCLFGKELNTTIKIYQRFGINWGWDPIYRWFSYGFPMVLLVEMPPVLPFFIILSRPQVLNDRTEACARWKLAESVINNKALLRSLRNWPSKRKLPWWHGNWRP